MINDLQKVEGISYEFFAAAAAFFTVESGSSSSLARLVVFQFFTS